MLKMSRMTDYGTVVLACLATQSGRVYSASEVAQITQLNEPTVKKILKTLAKADLVASYRGQSGGYALIGTAQEISAATILDVLEGPVALTECSTGSSSCQIQSCCTVGHSWQRINHQIRQAMEHISLAQLIEGGTSVNHAQEIEISLPIATAASN